ncbi:hypothetical protein B0H14DRAFT_2659507, partial [Mycena olivaceomarginata]
ARPKQITTAQASELPVGLVLTHPHNLFNSIGTLTLISKQSIWEPFHSEDNMVYHIRCQKTLEKVNFPPFGSLPALQRLKASGGRTGTQFALSLTMTRVMWIPYMDDLVAKQLDQLSRGVQEVYNTVIRGAEVSAQWWPFVDTYSDDCDQALRYLWGNDVFRTVGPSELLKLWWAIS